MKHWFEGFFENKRETVLQILLIVGIAVAGNYLAEQLIWRFDLTQDNRYTLSEASRDIAAKVKDPINVTAYFSADLPPQMSRAKDEFQNFLDEFRVYSGGNLEYKFVNPNADDQAERKAQQAGVRPVMLDVRKRDQVSQKRAYFGAVFRYRDRKEVVPLIQPGSAMEYTIASTVKKLTVQQKPKVGVLQGDGEPTLRAMQQLNRELSQQYAVQQVSGLDTTAVPADIEVLLVIGPKHKLSGHALQAIDQYLMAGGHVIFALNRVRANVQMGNATEQSTGVDQLLKAYHLPVNADLVRDVNATPIQVQQRQGGFSIINQVRYPYIPQIQHFGDHPISKGLETTVFQFVSSLDTTQVDSAQHLSVLASSSDQAGIAKEYFNLNPMQDWNQGHFNRSNIPVAAALTGVFRSAFAGIDSVDVPLKQSKQTAIVVFGDADFVVNGEGQRRQGLPGDNISLMVNSVDWLADDTGLIALRTKGVTSRPLVNLEDGTKALIKYFNVFFPIAMVLGYGFYRYQRRKVRRRRWMEEGV